MREPGNAQRRRNGRVTRKHCLSQFGVIRDGEWELIIRHGEYLAIHKCEMGAFSWEEGPQWTATGRSRNYDGTGPLRDKCMGCHKAPPVTMQGFVKMLEWER
jgi:hypothetical protein